MQLVGKTNIDFIGMRRYSFLVSGILTLLGLISLGFITFGQANLSIDFSGGTLLQGSFANSVSVGDLRSALANEGYADASIQQVYGSVANTFIIKVKNATSGGENDVPVARLLQDAIGKALPGNTFKVDSVQEVGPTVGKELQGQARWAVIIALAGILVYIWIRFDFRFSVAATIATFHDVFAALGFMFVLQREISLLVVSALLTLAGYSLTDTVVVFDRIRENLRTFRKKGDYIGAVNSSINEVLSRTLITSMTAFISVLVILFVCGAVVRDFALTLAFGILVGTYSSVFVAAPILVVWEVKSPKRFK